MPHRPCRHAVFDVVVDDEVGFFVGEAEQPSQLQVDLVDDWFGGSDLEALRLRGLPRVPLIANQHRAVLLHIGDEIVGEPDDFIGSDGHIRQGKLLNVARVQVAQIRGDGVPPPK